MITRELLTLSMEDMAQDTLVDGEIDLEVEVSLAKAGNLFIERR